MLDYNKYSRGFRQWRNNPCRVQTMQCEGLGALLPTPQITKSLINYIRPHTVYNDYIHMTQQM